MNDPVRSSLDGEQLSAALVSGIHQLIADQRVLNEINVFPVADGDTGTNLALSLGAALELLQNPEQRHLGTLLAALADALLDSARGNSGAIVAQFFQGVSDSAGELTRFTTYTFSNAIDRGSEYAHDALSNPLPGTILSVMAAFADSVRHHANKEKLRDFPLLFEQCMPDVEQALAATTDQLDVLRKAGVVDAGAKGFVDLLRGMNEYLQHGRMVDKPDLSVLDAIDTPLPVAAEDYAYRYCTECIISGQDIDRRKLREALSELGDSLVLAGTKRKAKVHIHVNEPDRVFDLGREFGDVSAEKADDLLKQQQMTQGQQKSFAVICDSAADISDSDLESFDIHVVPCRVQFGQRSYIDKVSISSAEFFAELESNPQHPTTSQPAPGDFRRQFQYLASHYDDVLSINLSGAASGTLEAARSAAARIDAPGTVHVVDTLNASLGQGLLVVHAAECAGAGMSAADAIASLEALIPQTRTFALVDDLSYAVRGGRLPRWVQTLAGLLRITPVLRTTERGTIGLGGCLFGKRNRIKNFARLIARRVPRDRPLTVAFGHAAQPEVAAQMEQALRDALPSIRRLAKAELGSALGVHSGPGALVVGVLPAPAGDGN